jgi:hypothetical protein
MYQLLISPAEYEPLLNRKEGNRVPSLLLQEVWCLLDEQKRGGERFTIGQMQQVALTAAQRLLSPFSSPFFGMKFIDDYRLWRSLQFSRREHSALQIMKLFTYFCFLIGHILAFQDPDSPN